MKNNTAIVIVSLVVLTTVLLFKGVNININLTEETPPELAFLKEVLQRTSSAQDVEFFYVEPQQGYEPYDYQGYESYGSYDYPQFFKDMQTVSPPIQVSPSENREELWNEMLTDPQGGLDRKVPLPKAQLEDVLRKG